MDEIDYMQEVLGFGKTTRMKYEQSLKKYSEFHKMSLEELLEEAEEDEDKGVKKRKRRINKRIIGFKNYVESTPQTHPRTGKEFYYSANSIQTMMKNIKAFYNVYEITVPKIRNLPIVPSEKYDDTITKEMIIDALRLSNNLKHQAIITALAVSGIDSDTLRKITWGDFLKATVPYHRTHGTVNEQLKELRNCDNAIAMFYGVRGKTNYEHIFFFNPEAVIIIARWGLTLKRELQEDEIIFQLTGTGLSTIFARLNDKMGLGKTSRGTRRVFHAHGLRNYVATTLLGTTFDGMMLDSLMIEFMLGHSINPTTAAYYKRKPEALKETYIRIMPHLSLEKVNVRDIDSPAYQRMEKKLENYEKLEGRINELEKLQDLLNNKEKLIREKTERLEES